VKGTLVLTAARPERLYVEVPGQIVSIDVRDNEPVKAGETVIARLINPDLALERLKRTEDINIQTVEAEIADITSTRNPLNRQKAQYTREMIAEDLEPALAKVVDQLGKLTIFAGRDGVAMGVPNRETSGKWMQAGELFCEVGDPKALEAHLLIDQSDVELINSLKDTKAKAWVKIYGASTRTIPSYVEQIAKRNREEIPPELSNLAGGEIAATPDQETGGANPVSAVFEAIIPIDNSDLTLQAGQRGTAKIDGGTATLGWWLWRLVNKTFRFSL
jgi:putative peptide zinc metalloprotease protein